MNNIYRITSKDTKVTKLAKQAAIICCFTIHNPLHVSFEDGNIRGYYDDSFESEYKWNEEYRSKNGDKMFRYIENFLDNFTALSIEERKECYSIFYNKTWRYLGGKICRKVNQEGLRTYRQYLGDDGYIYIALADGKVLYKF